MTDLDRNTSYESERQNLLDRLLDAVKQCQVRFGGKSELATDGDSRISCLCTQWEVVFQHGLKKTRKGNALMQVTGLSKAEPDPVMWLFIKEHLNPLELDRFTRLKNIYSDAGKGRAWLRSTLNEHTLEKYIHSFLGNVNLLRMFYENEAFLLDGERSSMLAMMAAGLSSILFAIKIDSEELNTVKQTPPSTANLSLSTLWSHYVPASNQKTDLPSPVMSASAEELFKSSGKTKKKRKKKISANIVPIDDGDSESHLTASSCDDIHYLSMATKGKESNSKKTFVKGHNRSSSLPVWKPSEFSIKTQGRASSIEDESPTTLQEHINENAENTRINMSRKDNHNTEGNEIISQPLLKESSTVKTDNNVCHTSNQKAVSESKNFYFSIPSINESCNYNDESSSTGIPREQIKEDNSPSIYSSNLNISATLDMEVDNNESLMTIDSTQKSLTPVRTEYNDRKTKDKPGNTTSMMYKESDAEPNDNISISSAFSLGEETSLNLASSATLGLNNSANSVNDVTQQALAACSDVQRGMDQFTNFSSITRTLGDGRDTPEQSSPTNQDGISTSELKQAIVSMMLRKDEIEEENRSLKENLEEVEEKLSAVNTELSGARKEMDMREERDSTRIQNLSRENELLKHQLKKYVGAVQLLRRDLQGHQSQNTDQVLAGIRHEDPLPPIPEKKQSEELSDYSLSKDYEKKLIQVAEMHGELIEFNERLQRLLNSRESKLRRLTEELIHLRGPLPEDNEDPSDLSGLDLEHCLASRNSRPLINVWIPSAFIQGKSSSFHHVYQVYIRIKDDEWNVYRRYSQFHEVHKKMKSKFPAVRTFNFPPKKSIGNRDTKFVEERRRLLQDYLRMVVNLLVNSLDLSAGATKETLIKWMPIFKDPYPPEKSKRNGSTSNKDGTPPQHYTGL